MEQITTHFFREEFDCKDGTPVPHILRSNLLDLCINLEVLRKEFGEPILITSGYRTVSWNKKQGGAPRSKHLLAQAADIKIVGFTPFAVARRIEGLIEAGRMKEGGVGIYNSWVHYDIRGYKTRWDYSKLK